MPILSFKITLFIICIALICFSISQHQPKKSDPHWLDHPATRDPSCGKPEYFLVSHMPPEYLKNAFHVNPSNLKEMPVIIAVHGYGASTHEWAEFVTAVKIHNQTDSSPLLVSQILLNGHGTHIDDLRSKKWESWGEPILTEYHRLLEQGYTTIHFVGASTGATLLINYLSKSNWHNHPPKKISLICPFLDANNPFFAWIPFLYPFVSDIDTSQNNTADEHAYFYQIRSKQSLKELAHLTHSVKKQLKKGILPPEGTTIDIIYSSDDPTVAKSSVKKIQQGIRNAYLTIKKIPSSLHVFTRLNGRKNISPHDKKNQSDVFQSLIENHTSH